MSTRPRPDRSEFGRLDIADFSPKEKYRLDWPLLAVLLASAAISLGTLYVAGSLLLAVLK